MIIKNGKKVSTLYIAGKKVSKVYSGGQLVYKQSTPTPTILGEFTINSNGDKVGFAPGNLQYQASTGLWRFAEHQWDFVGDSTYGNVYENGIKCDNGLISSSYSGWIDLFGFGTSGYNNGQNAYMPHSASRTTSDYYGLDLNGTTADWGYAYGQQNGGTWRTLTKDEWGYIINTRSGNRYAKCQIDGQYNCLIIFPDNYTTSLSNVNTDNAAFDLNQLTTQDANNLTNDGCIILPTGGYRSGYNMNYANSYGDYSSSIPRSTDNLWRLHFSSGNVSIGSLSRNVGFAIRLIQDIPSN